MKTLEQNLFKFTFDEHLSRDIKGYTWEKVEIRMMKITNSGPNNWSLDKLNSQIA